MVITAKACFIQFNWYVYVIKDTNATTYEKLEDLETSRLYKIAHVYDSDRVTVAFTENAIMIDNYSTIEYKVKKSKPMDDCYLVSHVAPNNKPILSMNESEILENIWKISTILVKVPVEILGYQDSACYWKHSFDQPSPKKNSIVRGTMLCVIAKNNLFDTCAPDLGAPIFCENTLVGILSTIMNRPPDGIQNSRTTIPLHVPNSCYTQLNDSNIEENYSYLAENLKHYEIHTFIKGITARRESLGAIGNTTSGGTSLHNSHLTYIYYFILYFITILFLNIC